MQFSILARQIEPERSRYLKNVLQEATKKPYSYLIMNFTQEQKDECRYISHNYKRESLNLRAIFLGDFGTNQGI